MCYGFHIITGLPFKRTLIEEMSEALGVKVEFFESAISSGKACIPTGDFVEFYDVIGFDLKMAVGYSLGTLRACGRLVTTNQIEQAEVMRDIDADGPYFDMMNYEYRYGEYLGVFLSPRYDDQSKDH